MKRPPSSSAGLAVSLVLVLSACTGGSAAPQSRPGRSSSTAAAPDPLTHRVIFDTDMGLDDVFALLFLAHEPSVELLAVTVSGTGEAHCGPGVRNAMSVLSMSGLEDVPVACGPSRPLAGHAAFPADWRESADRFFGVPLPVPEDRLPPPSGSTAEELIADVVESETAPVELLTVGPLTNIGSLLRQRPDLASRIERVVAMAGTLDAAGNVADQPVAEWNVFVDPTAARMVIESGIPVSLVPLDATNDAPLTSFFVRALEGSPSTVATDLIAALLAANPDLVDGPYWFWDSLAAVTLVDPSVVTYEKTPLDVIDEGPESLLGWVRRGDEGPKAEVAVAADQVAFEEAFLAAVAGAPVDASRPAPDLTVAGTLDGCTYEGPSSVPEGEVVVGVRAERVPEVGVVAIRLLDDHTYEDLVALVARLSPPVESRQPPRWARIVGWAGSAGDEQGLVLWRVAPGSYGLVCGVGQRWEALAPLEVAGPVAT